MGSNIIEGSKGTPTYVDFVMPKVKLGRIVLWSYTPDGEKSPAVVVKVGARSIALNVIVDGVKDHVLKTGTRHKDDPFIIKFPQHEGGCWCDTEDWERTERLLLNFEVDDDK